MHLPTKKSFEPPGARGGLRFWVGYAVYSLLSAFILGSERPSVEKLSRILVFAVLFGSYILTLSYPGTLVFIAGFGGMFSGIGVRALLWLDLRSQWAHCSVRGTDVWAEKKKAGLYCPKRTLDLIIRIKSKRRAICRGEYAGHTLGLFLDGSPALQQEAED